MLKENSLFNRILQKLFKRKLIYKKGVIWNREEKIQYQCTGCKKQHWDLPDMSGEKYQWSWDDQWSCQLQPELNDEDLDVYGWVVEMRNKKYSHRWENYWNKRVYWSKTVAMEALNQISTVGYFNDYEFRIKPLYDVDIQYFRNIKISRLLKEKNK